MNVKKAYTVQFNTKVAFKDAERNSACPRMLGAIRSVFMKDEIRYLPCVNHQINSVWDKKLNAPPINILEYTIKAHFNINRDDFETKTKFT
jgi:hypothetical protein